MHAVHHAHAPNQGDRDHFESRLPRRRPNPPFHVTNSKAGPSVTELQPQTTVGHRNLPRRSYFRVLDAMQNHVPCSCTMPRTMHMHNRLSPNPRIMPFPSNRRTTCRRSPALKKPWPKKLWVPTNETEIRIRLSGGNVESEETVATTRGGELWCGAGSQVGLRCPTSSRSVARRRSPPSSPHFRPSAQR